MATIQRINIIGSREGSRNRRRLKPNQTVKRFRVGIKSNISTNRNNLISSVDKRLQLNAMKKTTIASINPQSIKADGEPFRIPCLLNRSEKRGENRNRC